MKQPKERGEEKEERRGRRQGGQMEKEQKEETRTETKPKDKYKKLKDESYSKRSREDNNIYMYVISLCDSSFATLYQ